MEELRKGKSQSFASLFREIIGRLPMRRRKQFWILFAAMVSVACLETVATVGIALFASTVSSPEEVLHSDYIISARRILGVDFFNNVQGLIISVSALVMSLIVLKNGIQVLLRYQTTRFAYLMDEFFGAMLFNGFLRMPYEWHLSKNTADIILAVEWRVFLGSNFVKSSFQILSDTLVVAFLLLALFLAQPIISIMLVVVLGCTAYFIHTRMHLLQEKAADQCRRCDQSINREVTKGIHGIKDLKVSGRISCFLRYFKRDANPLARYRGLQSFYLVAPIGLLETIGFLMLTSTVCLMVLIMESSAAEVAGIITLLAVAAWRVIPAINRILGGFTAIRSVLPYTQNEIRYVEEIEATAKTEHGLYVETPRKFAFKKEIRMDNISFAYGSNGAPCVIKDVSFRIGKGQTVGFVGSSGGGKSTIVDILIGLLPPTSGQLVIDGCKLEEESRYAWMSSVGYVPQSPYIYDGSLAGNVAFGFDGPEIDRDFVLKCCEMAYMQDFLRELTHGIDTDIGERGVRLSGGQQQRVAIARALYSKPEVLIFDEATSSLDTKSEKAIQNTIYSLKGKHTLIIIAHRLSTVMDCDLLVWIEKGRIRMIDTPENVLSEYEYKQ
ncbi:ABC transporter ATP-binding protein/permease [Acidobacteria bacterium AH-259-D05]|nr:ABC transporter ATP-binding protein/permease [Acidobacteria bacterium AH-259-D05]